MAEKMIDKFLSEQVLTIGCEWKNPKGGIAVVLNSYSRIFSKFNVVVNSNGNNVLMNLFQLVYSLIYTFFLLMFCRKLKIVHIHTASYNSFRRTRLFIFLTKFFRRKVVLHVHGGGFKEYFNKNKDYVLKRLEKCDVIIALTESWKVFFNEMGLKNVMVVPNIVDMPIVGNTREIDGKVHMLYLGLITKQKGIYDLIDMISEYKEILKDKLILHIGGNGEIKELQKLIVENSLAEFVKFEGWVSGSKKCSLLSQSDIFILPSYIEGLPISILEAMAYKLPIISTPVGGIPEIIEDGKNGFLVTPGDKKELYKVLRKLVDDGDLRHTMGNFSYEKVESHLPDAVSHNLQTIYQKLL